MEDGTALDARRLACFVAVAEELHFTRAAARLRLTQSALSQQIARLEGEIGVALLVRGSRRVSLTVAGAIFLEGARATLAQAGAAAEAARRAARGEVGQLALGFVEAAPMSILPRLVTRFRAACPDVHLGLVEMLTVDAAAAILTRRLDAALLRPMPETEELERLVLWREPYVVALPAQHPLAAAQSVPLAALRGEPFVATSPRMAGYVDSRFRGALARAGVRPHVVQEVNQLTAVAGLVGAGVGVALMPASATRLGMEGVIYRPLAGRNMPFAEMMLAWRRGETAPTVARLIAVARVLLAATPADAGRAASGVVGDPEAGVPG
ncbi:LysR substrate-binding domain-containing protein [Teichococcus coralli]|nr:LysR substrate-binding domain-containing protein [Pseudoroseomonas coralli]